MIVVSGCMRSGTSLLMQTFRVAGLPVIGKAFPENFSSAVLKTNPRGFWESEYRNGIKDEHEVSASETKGHVVKIFVHGLLVTDRKYIECVVAPVRNWRDVVESKTEQDEVENAFRPNPVHPAYNWWIKNVLMVYDAIQRKYKLCLVDYERLLHDTVPTMQELFAELGIDGPVPDVVCEGLTTERKPVHSVDLDPELVSGFDLLYDLATRRVPPDAAAWRKLELTDQLLRERSAGQRVT